MEDERIENYSDLVARKTSDGRIIYTFKHTASIARELNAELRKTSKGRRD